MTTELSHRPSGDLASKAASALSSVKQRKNPGDWRWTKRILGEINGLPMSRGVLVATNGIICLIEQGGDSHFEGHLQWFVPDESEDAGEVMRLRKDKAAKKEKSLVDDLLEGFEV